jgi:hypothetical protein
MIILSCLFCSVCASASLEMAWPGLFFASNERRIWRGERTKVTLISRGGNMLKLVPHGRGMSPCPDSDGATGSDGGYVSTTGKIIASKS